jgi:hypothetical protein
MTCAKWGSGILRAGQIIPSNLSGTFQENTADAFRFVIGTDMFIPLIIAWRSCGPPITPTGSDKLCF